ncbi:hypothetical protein C8R26_10342 [Nitrosomonas oligotropha]|uniref:Uncharacterized protein n=1 Tax=Nitrosomonas oligotropha TaxID=42354 RepID=A0A2T5I395_9PROT|nr:hypothetical protein [Nitrosomonas oligotropha]PTQ78280.1 hypothetical protein C8R26_10342 [Nitrosomonas oligotropha]
MGLSDWLTSLFSSKNDEENKTNENSIERDDEDQAGSDSALQDVSEIKPESVESEIQVSSEADVLHNNDEPQETSL